MLAIPFVFLRHPFYFISLLLILIPSLYLVLPIHMNPRMTALRFPPNPNPNADRDTAYRLAQAEVIYQNMVKERDRLIMRYGPYPSDIEMFPPNKSPWPAYTIWDYFPAAFNCPYEVRRMGMMGDGGKWVCGLSRLVDKKDCVVYSVSINPEASFEASVLLNTNHCKIYGYDFYVKRKPHRFTKHIPHSERHRIQLRPYVLGAEDRERPGSEDEPEMYTLQTLMQMNGHKHIDILKVDVEGWEFDIFTNIIKSFVTNGTGSALPFGQLQLEIHVWDKNFEEVLKWWEGLEEAGLRPFWTEPNLVYVNYAGSRKPELAEYSFLNVKGENAFIV